MLTAKEMNEKTTKNIDAFVFEIIDDISTIFEGYSASYYYDYLIDYNMLYQVSSSTLFNTFIDTMAYDYGYEIHTHFENTHTPFIRIIWNKEGYRNMLVYGLISDESIDDKYNKEEVL